MRQIEMKFDPKGYICKPHGALRLAEIALSIVVIIALQTARFSAHGSGFVWFSSVLATLCSFLLFWLYVFHVPELTKNLPWTILELISSGAWAFCYMTSFCIAIAGAVVIGAGGEDEDEEEEWRSNTKIVYASVAVFSFLLMTIFIADLALLYRRRKRENSLRAKAYKFQEQLSAAAASAASAATAAAAEVADVAGTSATIEILVAKASSESAGSESSESRSISPN